MSLAALLFAVPTLLLAQPAAKPPELKKVSVADGVELHPGMVRGPTAQLKAHALGAWSTRWLALPLNRALREAQIEPLAQIAI
jgi:hypothetical protein